MNNPATGELPATDPTPSEAALGKPSEAALGDPSEAALGDPSEAALHDPSEAALGELSEPALKELAGGRLAIGDLAAGSLALDIATNVEAWSGKHRGQENFPVGSLLVQPALRPHVHAFYTFARNADDIADSPDLAPPDKLARLDIMQAVLLGHQEAGSPSAAALRASLAATGVPAIHATDLLRAFRQDATQTRYPTWESLLDYCRYSAMPVGRHVLALHGEAPDCTPPSDALSAALQILNHLQDAAGDLAALDRCYLPQDWLAQAGSSTEDACRPAETPALRRVFNQLLDRTDVLNQQAADLPRRVQDRRLRLETAVILGLSRRLAARLRHADPLASRVKLRRTDLVASLASSLAASLAGAARHLSGRRP